MKKIIACLSVIFIVILLNGCAPDDSRPLADVEIKEYQGEDLSSIYDFRENSIKGVQEVDIEKYSLTVDGLVENPAVYTYDQVLLKDPYTKKVTLNCVEGWSVDILWEGVKISDIINDLNVKKEANTIIFHSVDGYTTSLPLDFIIDKNILLAYKMNGVVIPPERGYPFQVVAEDKLGYKWAKWVNRIELSKDENYQGYWESRGYDNKGDIK
ncbi:MAG: molybdopterin-dependent oxidoreductase [Eubacteriaceae bacterium]|nr:molybdopterin-dependent oxidoreductase [Eubacteriaceae bacterium]